MMGTKSKIVEIIEIGYPQSLIQREGEPTSELIDSGELKIELEMLGEDIAERFNKEPE